MKPQPKVAAGGIAGAAAVVIVWGAEQAGLNVPTEVAVSIVAVIQFLGAYLKS